MMVAMINTPSSSLSGGTSCKNSKVSGKRWKVSMKQTEISSNRSFFAIASNITQSPAMRAVVKIGFFFVLTTVKRASASSFLRKFSRFVSMALLRRLSILFP